MHRINSPPCLTLQSKVLRIFFSFPFSPFLIFPLAGVSLRPRSRSRRRRQRYNLFARATSTGVGPFRQRNKA